LGEHHLEMSLLLWLLYRFEEGSKHNTFNVEIDLTWHCYDTIFSSFSLTLNVTAIDLPSLPILDTSVKTAGNTGAIYKEL